MVYLFQSLVVDEAGGILGDLELPLLNLLAKLPVSRSQQQDHVAHASCGSRNRNIGEGTKNTYMVKQGGLEGLKHEMSNQVAW